jgi:hypothetical protein
MSTSQPIQETSATPRSGNAGSHALAGFDPRADGAARRIAFDHECVAILRRYKGIDMRVAVPVATYRGVMLAPPTEGENEAYEVRLVHGDPDLSVTLYQTSSKAEGVPEWRLWARFFGLPPLVEGVLANDSAPAGRGAAVGEAPKVCRSVAVAATRWPRFLTRRKVGRAERMQIVHRGEREIIARN